MIRSIRGFATIFNQSTTSNMFKSFFPCKFPIFRLNTEMCPSLLLYPRSATSQFELISLCLDLSHAHVPDQPWAEQKSFELLGIDRPRIAGWHVVCGQEQMLLGPDVSAIPAPPREIFECMMIIILGKHDRHRPA
jgi:hypothetical protein